MRAHLQLSNKRKCTQIYIQEFTSINHCKQGGTHAQNKRTPQQQQLNMHNCCCWDTIKGANNKLTHWCKHKHVKCTEITLQSKTLSRTIDMLYSTSSMRIYHIYGRNKDNSILGGECGQLEFRNKQSLANCASLTSAYT